jgi:nucleotide-binding universal stress UspA family protein
MRRIIVAQTDDRGGDRGGGGVSQRIVVGVDGSDTSVAALRWAADLASRIGSSIEAVTTWQWPTGVGPVIPFPMDYDPAGDARGMLETLVQPVADRYPSVPVESRIVEGHAAEALVEGSRHADLLVVGSRGHGAFSGMLLGSVSQHCATHAACPVLIYRDRPDPD